MKTLCLLLFCSFAWVSFSQKTDTRHKKSLKLYHKANEQVASRKFDDALAGYTKAIDKDPDFSAACLKLAHLYAFLANPDSAYVYYKKYYLLAHRKAVINGPTARSLSYRFLKRGDYDLARQAFDLFLDENNQKPLDNRDSLMFRSLRFIDAALANPLEVVITPLTDNINAFALQYFPVLTIDNSTIFFTRRKGTHAQYDEDIMMSKFEDGRWSKATGISANINSEFNEGACSVSADGRTLILTSCEGRKSYGNCDLYMSVKKGENWTKPQNMGNVVNSPYWDSQPSLSADAKKLYFASNRPGGFGKRDIWFTSLTDGQWQKPVNVGGSINTAYDETTPFIHVNGETLFFASDGHSGMGGFDVFVSERTSGQWTAAKNLGYPINNFNHQSGFFIPADGKGAYYTSESGNRSLLYYLQLTSDSLVSHKATYLTGSVFDKLTHKKIHASITLYDLQTREKLYETATDTLEGSYFVALKSDGQYGAYAEAAGYLFEDFRFDLQSSYNLEPDTLNIFLQPIDEGVAMTLENIYFETDSYELLPESLTEIELVADFIKTNKLKVEIRGHTDSSGEKNYNMKLSELRAKAVYEQLVKLGVSPDLLSSEGFGDTVPVFPNDREGKNLLNRRIEFKIIQYTPD